MRARSARGHEAWDGAWDVFVFVSDMYYIPGSKGPMQNQHEQTPPPKETLCVQGGGLGEDLGSNP